jgi:hypothetical protein
MTVSMFAEGPQEKSYLAVISNSSNAPVVSTPVVSAEATGSTGLLSSGTVAENTPYWNGTIWVITNSTIHNNGSEVEIASTSQGFLPPHMTTAERDGIASLATGLTIYNTTKHSLQWWNGGLWVDDCDGPFFSYAVGSVFCASGATTVLGVTNPSTGKTWMDRNLGASQVATSSTDANSYGDLYQWGRGSDGHQCRTSATTATLSSSDQPGNGEFILTNSLPYEWRSPQNDNLWQGVNGTNNPCPSGYRLPTEAELNAERLSWSSNNAAGAFASPLKLPMAGGRDRSSGSLDGVGSYGLYWNSTVSGTNAGYIFFNSSNASMYAVGRAGGGSVRCIDATIVHPSTNGTAVVSGYSCSTASAGTMVAGIAVSGVTQTITATVTTVGTYSISTTANGVTFAGSGTFAGTGAQNIVLTASGTPTAAGSNTFTLNTTPNCGFSRTTVVFCASGATTVVEVISSTGKTWMDRNLGASQVATSSTDANSYGDLYQWGRGSDGHQCRTSATTATLSSGDQPGHGEFILAPSAPNDWRSPQNTNLWQGVNGVNNPCPSGYRLPTEAELDAERLSWSSNNAAGAFASPLKLPMAGFRSSSGSLLGVGFGLYWSSTVSSTRARNLNFDSGGAVFGYFVRASGGSVRCLKD